LLELVPAPRVHADLAPSSAFAAPDEQRASAVVEIGFGEGERFLDA
jgi:tRNA G46 methylase TrmB